MLDRVTEETDDFKRANAPEDEFSSGDDDEQLRGKVLLTENQQGWSRANIEENFEKAPSACSAPIELNKVRHPLAFKNPFLLIGWR